MHAIIHRIFGHIDFRSGGEVNLRNEPSIYRDAHLQPASHVKPATTKPRRGIYFVAPPDSTELRNVYPDGVILSISDCTAFSWSIPRPAQRIGRARTRPVGVSRFSRAEMPQS